MARLFRRQKDNNLYHTGYRVEDIHSNQPVKVKEDSVLVGDVYAPRVIVAGLVYGYIVAGEVVVEASGQVWGDICATSINTLPGSRVHGWISSLDEGTIDLLRLGQLTIDEVPRSGELAVSSNVLAKLEKLSPQLSSQQAEGTKRLEIWRQLQSVAGAAIAARVELEQSFGVAVSEEVGILRIGELGFEGGSAGAPGKHVNHDGSKDLEVSRSGRLPDAEKRVAQLSTRLKTALRQVSLLQNELIWTKASLLQSRGERQVNYGNENQQDLEGAEDVRGRQLARLQATIVERDLKLKELQAQIETREEQLFRLQALATRRIESLEQKLIKIKRQSSPN